MRRVLLLLLLVLTQIGAAPAPAVPPIEQPLSVPLVAVLANPERFDGKLVTVEGFLNLEFEGDAIYLGRSDFEEGLVANSVWVNGPDEPAARRNLTGRHVILTGRFEAGPGGHMGMFSGTFEDVSAIRTLRSRKQSFASVFQLYSDLPWPLLIVILLAATGGMAMVVALAEKRAPSASKVPIVWGALLVAAAVAAFSVCRLWEHPLIIHVLVEVGDPSMIWPLLVEFVVGIAALAASAIFAIRRRLLPCLLFAAAQLVVPAAIEMRGFQIQGSPLSIYSAKADDYDWGRSAAPVP